MIYEESSRGIDGGYAISILELLTVVVVRHVQGNLEWNVMSMNNEH